jgi:hypothetical protein
MFLAINVEYEKELYNFVLRHAYWMFSFSLLLIKEHRLNLQGLMNFYVHIKSGGSNKMNEFRDAVTGWDRSYFLFS